MRTGHTSGFVVDDITVGPYAHGFGVTGDGHTFAFRTVGSTLRLEIYRAGLASAVPAPEDISAAATARVTDIDLDDERSIIALVRDTIPHAVPPAPTTRRDSITMRALLGRISAIITTM